MYTQTFKALKIKAKQQVYTLLAGHNLSKLISNGYDFAQLREYQMGDDIRKINWKITAKLSKPYIKELHANRELSVVVASFMDAGCYFGKENKKQKKITEIATLLAYATQSNNDLFTGISYTQNETYSTYPTKQLFQIEGFLTHLWNTPLLGTSLNYQKSLQSLFKRLHKPSLIFILFDFMEAIDLSLLAQKHEVIVIIARDTKEEFPEKLAEVTLLNPHNQDKLDTYFSHQNKKSYIEKLHAHDQKQEAHLSKYAIRWVKILTHEEPLSKLISLFY